MGLTVKARLNGTDYDLVDAPSSVDVMQAVSFGAYAAGGSHFDIRNVTVGTGGYGSSDLFAPALNDLSEFSGIFNGTGLSASGGILSVDNGGDTYGWKDIGTQQDVFVQFDLRIRSGDGDPDYTDVWGSLAAASSDGRNIDGVYNRGSQFTTDGPGGDFGDTTSIEGAWVTLGVYYSYTGGSVPVDPGPTYVIHVDPAALVLPPASPSGTSSISLVDIDGFSEAVDLTLSGVPAGANAHLSATHIPAGGGPVTLTVNITGNVGPGFVITIQGVSAGTGITKTAIVSVETFFVVNDYTNTSPATALALNPIGCPENSVQFDTANYPASTCTDRVFVSSALNSGSNSLFSAFFPIQLNSSYQGPSGVTFGYSGPERTDITVTAEIYIPSSAIPYVDWYNGVPRLNVLGLAASNFGFFDSNHFSLGLWSRAETNGSEIVDGHPVSSDPALSDQLAWGLHSGFGSVFGPATSDPSKVALDTWHTVSLRAVKGDSVYVEIDGVDYGAIASFSPGYDLNVVGVGSDGSWEFATTTATGPAIYVRSIKIGTGGYGSSDLYSRDLSAGDTLPYRPTSASDGIGVGASDSTSTLACWPPDDPTSGYGLPIDNQAWFKFANPTSQSVYGEFAVELISNDDDHGFGGFVDVRAGVFLGTDPSNLHRAQSWMVNGPDVYAGPTSINSPGDLFTVGAYVGAHETIYLCVGIGDYPFSNNGVLKVTGGFTTLTLYDTLDTLDARPHPELAIPTEDPSELLGAGVIAYPIGDGVHTWPATLPDGSQPGGAGGYSYCHHQGDHWILLRPTALDSDIDIGGLTVNGSELLGWDYDAFHADLGHYQPDKSGWPSTIANARSFICMKVTPDGTYTDIHVPPLINYHWNELAWFQDTDELFYGCTIASIFPTSHTFSGYEPLLSGWSSEEWSDTKLVSDGTDLWLVVLGRENVRYPWLTDYNYADSCGHTHHGPSTQYQSSVYNQDDHDMWVASIGDDSMMGDDAGWSASCRWWPNKIVVYHFNGTSFDRIGDIDAAFDNIGENGNGYAVSFMAACAANGTCHVIFSERGGYGEASGAFNYNGQHHDEHPYVGSRTVHGKFSASAKISENEFESSGPSPGPWFGGHDYPDASTDVLRVGRAATMNGKPLWIFAKGGLQDNISPPALLADQRNEPIIRIRNLAVSATTDVQTIDTDLIPATSNGDNMGFTLNPNMLYTGDFYLSQVYTDPDLGIPVFGLHAYWEELDGTYPSETAVGVAEAIYRVPADLSARPSYLDGARTVGYTIIPASARFGFTAYIQGDWVWDSRNLWAPPQSGFVAQYDKVCNHNWLNISSGPDLIFEPFQDRNAMWYDPTADTFYNLGAVNPGTNTVIYGVSQIHILRNVEVCTGGGLIICPQVGGIHGFIRFGHNQ